MKKEKIIAVLIVLVALIGSVTYYVTNKESERKSEYTFEMREEFIDGCTIGDDDMFQFCNCSYNSLTGDLSLEEFMEFAYTAESTKGITNPKIRKSVDKMMSECAKKLL